MHESGCKPSHTACRTPATHSDGWLKLQWVVHVHNVARVTSRARATVSAISALLAPGAYTCHPLLASFSTRPNGLTAHAHCDNAFAASTKPTSNREFQVPQQPGLTVLAWYLHVHALQPTWAAIPSTSWGPHHAGPHRATFTSHTPHALSLSAAAGPSAVQVLQVCTWAAERGKGL